VSPRLVRSEARPMTAVPLDPEMVRKEFAHRLRVAMEAKGWNQSDLARRAFGTTKGGGAIGRDRISNYLNARQLPERATLLKVCKALGMKPDDLLPNGGMVSPEFAGIEQRPVPGRPGIVSFRFAGLLYRKTAMEINELIHADHDKMEQGG
jgi:transcriptional regulator with XRE-family HTH domain